MLSDGNWCAPGPPELGQWILGSQSPEEGGMGRRGYPPEFRRKVLDLVEAGRSVADVASDLHISDQSIHSWRRQDRIDRGIVPGLTSLEKAELIAERKRIVDLEVEPKTTRRGMELVREAVPTKGVSKPSR